MHVEHFLKLYVGLTMSFGLLRAAAYREPNPENMTALMVAGPVLWPAYIMKDCVGLLSGLQCQRRWWGGDR
jgi:hypothetical protein